MNCHLAPSFMPKLTQIVQSIDPERTSPKFRLWLTTAGGMPPTLLQRGIKIRASTPKGIRANMINHSNSKYTPLQFKLLFFHALVQERRKFGAQGWNVRYEFDDSDLHLSLDIGNNAEMLLHSVSEIIYGGRITNESDRILLKHMLKEVLEGKDVPNIKQMPLRDRPSIFGLHSNVDISYAITETTELIRAASLLEQEKKHTPDDIVRDEKGVVEDVIALVPESFDATEARSKLNLDDCYSILLVHEMETYNALLTKITQDCTKIKSALEGKTSMNVELEGILSCIFCGDVPEAWRQYPSRKTLALWLDDLKRRVVFSKLGIKAVVFRRPFACLIS